MTYPNLETITVISSSPTEIRLSKRYTHLSLYDIEPSERFIKSKQTYNFLEQAENLYVSINDFLHEPEIPF